MKKLFPILTVTLAMFAGQLIAADANGSTDAEPVPEEQAGDPAASVEEETPAELNSGDTAWMNKSISTKCNARLRST